jgi:LPS-assembly protein
VHLRGKVRIETADALLTADEVDYNTETKDAEARGHVRFESFSRGEKLNCERAEYNTASRTGKFYVVSGTSPARIEARPGRLTTQNPFYFSGEWAEKTEDRYILHNGFLTDCLIPDPWWRLKGPVIDVIPRDRAIARSSWFYVKEIPIFYTPFFYKSLKQQPRRSGFLTPNVGNSSIRGKTVGLGYFWAINRSYDLTYRTLVYSKTGIGQQAEPAHQFRCVSVWYRQQELRRELAQRHGADRGRQIRPGQRMGGSRRPALPVFVRLPAAIYPIL